jgi:protein-disulfide isomerase
VSSPTAPPTRRQRRAAERETRLRPRGRPIPAGSRAPWRSPTLLISVAAIVVAAGAIAIGGGLGSDGGDAADLVPPFRATAPSTELVDGEAIGPADATASLVVYSDFQCPVCGRLAIDYLPGLTREFSVSGDLRVEHRAIAILGRGSPDESVEAAIGATCAADQGRFWSFHDWLFANQDGENRGAFSPERLAAIANELGLDRSAWDACVADPEEAASVRAATDEARAAGISATPTLDLNGERIVGLPRSYDDLASAVRTAIAAAGTGR